MGAGAAGGRRAPGERRPSGNCRGTCTEPVGSDPGGGWTRNISGFGDLAATIGSASPLTLQLANLHGDVVATLPAAGTSTIAELSLSESTEYGDPRVKPAAGTTLPRYGYLGTKQHDANTPGGLNAHGSAAVQLHPRPVP